MAKVGHLAGRAARAVPAESRAVVSAASPVADVQVAADPAVASPVEAGPVEAGPVAENPAARPVARALAGRADRSGSCGSSGASFAVAR